ncbi:MAG: hypothetical protein AAFZ65_18040, partial [Planctomycetota bacterium]
SVELYGQGPGQLQITAPGLFTPPLDPVVCTATLIKPDANGPFLIGLLLVDTAFIEPTFPLFGMDLWLDPLGALQIPLDPSLTPSAPLPLTAPHNAGLELHLQGVLLDPFTPGSLDLTATHAAKVVFAPGGPVAPCDKPVANKLEATLTIGAGGLVVSGGAGAVAGGATVTITDADGKSTTVTANADGSFFAPFGQSDAGIGDSLEVTQQTDACGESQPTTVVIEAP